MNSFILDGLESKQGIYVITQISTGKKYVGKSINVKRRVSHHLKSQGQEIHKVLRSFPLTDFEVRATYYPEKSPSELVDIEYQAIVREDSIFPKGFNKICRGISNIVSDEARRKMSDAWKKRGPFTDETRRKMSKAKTGIKLSDTTRKNMSIAQKKVNKKSRDFIFVHSKDDRIFVGSIKEFCESFEFTINSANANFSQTSRYKGWSLSLIE